MERSKIKIPKKVKKKEAKGEEEFPFDISPMHEGERVRKGDMFAELAGPKGVGFELVINLPEDQVEDMKSTLIGKDIDELEEGGRYPYAMVYYIAGSQLDSDIEPVVERRNHDFQNFIEGYMHLNQRYDIWVRLNKDAVKKGLNSLNQIAQATMLLFKNEMPFIEKIESVYITDGDLVEKLLEEYVQPIYEERDARVETLHDEDVDEFYSCTLCQSFAPANVCVISPDRPSLCGAITWFDGRAAARVDPEGPNKAIPKGELTDPIGGEYTGVDEFAREESGGGVDRVKLHSFFEYPHTSCGCFEVIGFYMPEVDGIGFVHRGYSEPGPNGLTFSTMAGQTGGGNQIIGFLGIGISYFRSSKFIQADGGWKRMVWMPEDLKQRIDGYIPEDIKDKIATDSNVKSLEELSDFLKQKDHPVVKGIVRDVDGEQITEGWEKEKEGVKEAAAEEVSTGTEEATPTAPTAPAESYAPQAPSQFQPQPQFQMPASQGGGIKLVIKDAKIEIDKVIISRKEEEKK
ncbi:MAG: CO dehydrogenase/CO-methylating acetyl-CoA synthase complex subunit beta [Archaeoglobaceae archaeon]